MRARQQGGREGLAQVLKSSSQPTAAPVRMSRAHGTLRRFLARLDLAALAPDRGRAAAHRGLAATTGGYPLIIKHAFDSLMKADGSALPWVLAAIVVVTAARSAFLYLHQMTTARIVARMVTDIQKAAFAHSDQCRLRAPDARNHRATWCRGSPMICLHPAGGPGVAGRLRQGCAVRRSRWSPPCSTSTG